MQPNQPSTDIIPIIEALSTLAAATIAFYALFQTRKLFIKQEELSDKIHRQEKLFAQQQAFFPLFEQFKDISTIDPNDPVWVDIINAVNYLELLGVSWEGETVDERTLFRVFGKYIIETYESIKQCKNPPQNIPKDGEEMLSDCPYATRLYSHLKNKQNRRKSPDQSIAERD
ncbi:MAG: hypothetical protein R3E39_32140 [Anaerolineae bacterium]